MTRTHSRLLLALIGSLLLHLLPFFPPLLDGRPAPKPAPSAPLEARMRPLPLAEQPTLKIDPPAPQVSTPQPARPSKPAGESTPPSLPKNWTQAMRQHFQKLQKNGDFYPSEAIAQGLEGEALVLIMIDESGNVVAARLEQSSGYRLLDDAALRAVRSVRSLPADAPRETILPVRFRLR